MVVLPPSGDVEFMAETIHWCQRSYLELGALASAVPCARKHAYLVAGEWGVAELAETLELIVSEITTNAVMASARLTESRYLGQWAPGVPPVRIWLYSDGQRVLVQVWDGNDQAPVPRQPDAEAESGRGLLLVETLSESWGTYALEGTTGKVTWASVTR